MKAYKYRSGINTYDNNGTSLFYRDVESLFNNKIYAPTQSELNDPNESNVDDNSLLAVVKSKAKEIYPDLLELKKQLSNLGIYSLSMTFNNELLWAYYASGHKGFVIEYDLNYLIPAFTYSSTERMCYFIDVKYTRNFPVINPLHLYNDDAEKLIKLYLGNKSKNWKHEKESRLVLEKSGLIEFDYRSVTGIYFGYRMNKTEKDFIMNKLKGRGIRYYQMKLSKNYRLEAFSIEDTYYDSVDYIVNNLCYDPFLISKQYLGENYFYVEKVISALKIVCTKPLVEKIIGLRIHNKNPLMIEIYVKSSGIYPLKEFLFVLDKKENLVLIEDIERAKRLIQEEIREMNTENY